MHEAEESREVLLLVRMIEDSVGPVCGPVWPPTTLSHAPPKHMNIYKNIVIVAGGTEKMRDGVQGPAGASPDEIPLPPILWGGFSCDQVGGVICVTHSHATPLLKSWSGRSFFSCFSTPV